MDFLLGLDIGTTNIKGVLVSPDGTEIYDSKAGFTYNTTDDGKVEIDADTYIEVCASVIRELSQKLPAGGKICGISAASASGNLLLLDENNEPLTPIFNWQDKRVTTESTECLTGIDFDGLYEIVGWPFGGKGMPLALFCWVKKHQPEIIEKCKKIVMSTEYLFYKLTGKWGIGTSAGTPFFFIDQQKGEYNKELLKVLKLDEQMFPPIMETGEKLGEVTKSGEEIFGVKNGTAVVLGTFDHPSAARAVGVLNEGELLLSCGTSWVGFCPVNEREKGTENRLLIDPFLSPDGCWGTMFSLASVSVKLEKFIRKHITNSGNVFEELGKLAKKSISGANGLVLDPYNEYELEELQKYPKEDLARAVMEGVVRRLDERLKKLEPSGIKPNTAVMTGGPTQDPLWIEIIEEITGLSVSVKHGAFAGAIGAAMLAGISCGIYKDEKDAANYLKG